MAQPANFDSGAALVTLSAASASGQSADQSNPLHRGIKVYVNITAISGTSPTLTVTIQGKDPVSGQYFNVLASAALNATGFTVLTVYPGATVSANASASDVLPPTWRVSYAIAGTGPSVTATIAIAKVM